MAVYAYIKAGFVVNLVEHGSAVPSSTGPEGEYVTPNSSGLQVGAAFDVTADKNLIDRALAVVKVDDTAFDGKTLRAIAAVLVDEINVLRQWLASFKVEVAAATNLANLQSRVATLPATPNRTLAQARTAVKNAINAGSVDT